MSTIPEEQSLLRIPPTDPNAPQEIIRRAFARAKATVTKALDRVEQLILAIPLSWLAAVIISIVLGHAVKQFVQAVFGLLLIAKKRIPWRIGTLPKDQTEDLGEIHDIVHAASENFPGE